MLAAMLAGCGAGGYTLPSASAGGGRTTASATTSTGGFVYDVNPHVLLANAQDTPDAFPLKPSQCVAAFGLACYTPQLIRSAYDVPSTLTGAGRTIVIVDAYGSPTIKSDLHTFDLIFGLPDPPSFSIVYPGGSPTYNPLQHHGETGWAEETSLDVEWSHAIAPGANIVLVVAANNGGDVLDNAVKYAVAHKLGDVISQSYGAPEAAIRGNGNNLQDQQAHANFVAAANAGISVLASAGDSGAGNGATFDNALFPASDPLVTGVGGTNLFMSDTGVYTNETVWNDKTGCPFTCKDGIFGASGGAPSVLFPVPSFQAALGATKRTSADVSYNASVYTAVLTYLGFLGPGKNGLYFFGGTSEGAPQWAGIVALAGQQAGHSIGYLNPKLYAASATAFHDVTVGNNSFGSPGFSATAGFDVPTGLGSPDAAKIISAIGH
ncbi:S53 family peptidase [Vulcanimicrobium alpinum]|uniref:S53 family peptidase n=1 Tax=Vulcanimicrobium alpinum TaxID=3016050 RepID=UPI00295E7E7B|nr:S53 family peptidase [Vulcanimicrobium alpinum]